MPVYGVVMGQGVTANLISNTLYTGYISEDGERLQSCSAVAFVNTQTHEGGLYHFPAGSINTDRNSQKVLTQIVDKVKPSRAWIAFGISSSLNLQHGYTAMDAQALAAAGEHEQLHAYVMKLMRGECQLTRCHARFGNASLSWDGQPVFSATVTSDDFTIENLSESTAKKYEIYTLYGSNLNSSPLASSSSSLLGKVKKKFTRQKHST